MENVAAPGLYTAENGAGGPDFGPFRLNFSLPQRTFTWTNREALTSMTLSEGLKVAWDWPDQDEGYVHIGGRFENSGESYAAGFYCVERAERGSFTIPVETLRRSAGFVTPPAGGDYYLVLYVRDRIIKRIDAPGFDIGALELNAGIGPLDVGYVTVK
jgi:hypothetical protein